MYAKSPQKFTHQKINLVVCTLALSLTALYAPIAQAAEADNTSTDAQFTAAMNARDAGDYEASIAAFQGILSAEPTLNRARAELAVSYFRALNFAAAKEQAEKVLADPSTPDGVKATVQKFLEFVDQSSRTHVFTPYVTFGFGHDSNINVGPSNNTVNIGGAVLVTNATPISENYALFNAGVSHRYLSPTSHTLFGRSAAYIWQSNANYYRVDNFNSSDYDLDVLSLSTGPLAVVAERWRLGVDFTFDHILLGDRKLASFYGIAPSVTWNISKNTDITLNGKYQKREFNDSVTTGRDSDYETVGVNVGRAFLDTKLKAQAGISYFNEDADLSRFSNDGYEANIGASYVAWSGGSIYAKDVYKDSDFDGVEPLFNVARSQHENRATIGFNHRFGQSFIKDWTIDVNATRTENRANVSIYTFNRTQYGVTLGKYF